MLIPASMVSTPRHLLLESPCACLGAAKRVKMSGVGWRPFSPSTPAGLLCAFDYTLLDTGRQASRRSPAVLHPPLTATARWSLHFCSALTSILVTCSPTRRGASHNRKLQQLGADSPAGDGKLALCTLLLSSGTATSDGRILSDSPAGLCSSIRRQASRGAPSRACPSSRRRGSR